MKDWIGREMIQHDVLTPGLLKRLRATIDSDDAGERAPQGAHWCLCLPDARTESLDIDGHPKRGGFLPPIALPRRMWASSAIEFHAPMTVGANIERRSVIADVVEKQGESGHLVFVTVDHESHADGILAISERQVIVYRETARTLPARSGTGIPDLTLWQWLRRLTPSETLLFRYSALTFNSHRIHYDLPYAMNEEGYRGLVVHGPLLATLLLDLAGRELGANMLSRFAFRGNSPAFSGEPLHLVGRADAKAITMAVLGADGRTVMSAEAVGFR